MPTLSMLRVDISQLLVEPTTLASLGVKVTRQETVVLVVNTVVLLVLAVPPTSGMPTNWAAGAPLQLPFKKRLNVTDPLPGPPLPSTTVAVSFGSQSWAVVVRDTSRTRKHSFVLSVNGGGLS